MRKAILMMAVGVVFMAARAGAQCIDARPLIYPYPQKVCLGEQADLGAAYVPVDVGAIGAKELTRYKEYFNFIGLKGSTGAGEMLLTFSKVAPTHRTMVPDRQEGYTITVDPGPPLSIQIGAKTDIGFYYAFETLKQMISNGKIYTGEITDWPDFPTRGILEGGYGVWKYEDRIRILNWMGTLKMNYFIYGPKEGEKFRRRWRALYDPLELRDFLVYKKICDEHHVVFAYAISPALSMIYSDPKEFDRLLKKLQQLQSLGVDNFSIFFDDIIPPILGLGDKDVYKDAASAHIDVTNRIYEALKKSDPDVQVSFVPVPYWGVYDVLYNQMIVKKLNPDIKIGWTGNGIVSDTITKADIQRFIDYFHQPPALGDNWSTITINNRALDLWEITDAFVNNPYSFGFLMLSEERAGAQKSRFVSATLADYTWNSPAYDPETSLAVYCARQAGAVGGPMLKIALEINYPEGHDLGYKSRLKRDIEELGTLSGEAFEKKKAGIKAFLEEVRGYRGQALNEIKDRVIRDQFAKIFDDANNKIHEAMWIFKAGPPDPKEFADALGKEVAR